MMSGVADLTLSIRTRSLRCKWTAENAFLQAADKVLNCTVGNPAEGKTLKENHTTSKGLKGWIGRSYDLEAAFSNGIHLFDGNPRLPVNRPGKTACTLLEVNSMPFGATGSVCVFLLPVPYGK